MLAEGVETAEQVALLTGWGCRAGQSFYFAAPLNVEQVTHLLRAGNLRASLTPVENIDLPAAPLLAVPAPTIAPLRPAK